MKKQHYSTWYSNFLKYHMHHFWLLMNIWYIELHGRFLWYNIIILDMYNSWILFFNHWTHFFFQKSKECGSIRLTDVVCISKYSGQKYVVFFFIYDYNRAYPFKRIWRSIILYNSDTLVGLFPIVCGKNHFHSFGQITTTTTTILFYSNSKITDLQVMEWCTVHN